MAGRLPKWDMTKEELRKKFDDFRIRSGGIYTTQNSASLLIDFNWFYDEIEAREKEIEKLELLTVDVIKLKELATYLLRNKKDDVAKAWNYNINVLFDSKDIEEAKQRILNIGDKRVSDLSKLTNMESKIQRLEELNKAADEVIEMIMNRKDVLPEKLRTSFEESYHKLKSKNLTE